MNHKNLCGCNACCCQRTIEKHIKKICEQMKTYPLTLLLDSDRNKFINKFQKELLNVERK